MQKPSEKSGGFLYSPPVKRLLIAAAILSSTSCQAPRPRANDVKPMPKENARTYLKGSIEGIAVCQLYVDGWDQLTPAQRLYAWHLSRAALAGRDIYWDQMHRDALALRALLEGIVTTPGKTDAAALKKIGDFLDLLYVDSAPYDGHTLAKHVPEFSREELAAAAKAAESAGAKFAAAPLLPAGRAEELVARVSPLLFDANVDPLLTARAAKDGRDIVQGSGVNFYRGGVTLAEVEKFAPKFDLNSTIVKEKGALREEVWRAGDGAAHPAGLYAASLSDAIHHLEEARALATPEQAKVLDSLIRYYRTGEYSDFREYSIAWLKGAPAVDLVMGFIEDYHDPRAHKGSYEGMVYVPAPELSHRMQAIADRVVALERGEPWKDEYKKTEIHPPIAQAIQVVIETGDFSVRASPVGINLPNPQEIREKFGAKSVYLVNADRAANEVAMVSTATEFALPEDREEILKYGARAWETLVALHEIAGHASGKVSPKLKEDPSTYLREYYSALEEARADLVALWNFGDADLIKADVIESPATRRAAYKQYIMKALAQLRRASQGDSLGEDHLRAIQLIVEFARAQGAVERVERDGKHYDRLVDEQKFRAACGDLLSQLMAAKAEGNYDAAKKLIESYGVHFDPKIRDEVVARSKSGNVPSGYRFMSPRMVPVKDASGKVIDATLDYADSLREQELRYSGRLPE